MELLGGRNTYEVLRWSQNLQGSTAYSYACAVPYHAFCAVIRCIGCLRI